MLDTKYRPNDFDELIGQDALVDSLKAVAKSKVTRKFLFVGPSGCGKTTVSRIMARAAGSDDKDILEINAAKYTGVDDMREITNGIQYKPFGEDAVKSIIIDECHMLSKAAWNSLLKPIEEPPPWVWWFLCTTEFSKVPETIKTRCARYDLKPVATDLIYELLMQVAKTEKLEAAKSKGVIEICAQEAQGSPRQGLNNLAVCGTTADREVAAELLHSAIDSPDAAELAKVLLNRGSWSQAQRIIGRMKDTNPESIRQNVMRYVTAVILNSNQEKVAGLAIEVLARFGSTFNSGDGIAPVVVAAGRVLLS